MDLRNLIKWSVVLAAFLVYKNQANALDIPDSVYKEKYQQSTQMPDHLAYAVLIKDLSKAVAGEARGDAMLAVQERLGVSTEHSELVLNYLTASYTSMQESNHQVTNKLLCGEPNLKENETYALLDLIDDIKESHAVSSFQDAKVAVGEAHLDAWLADIKQESMHYRYDHKRVYEQLDMNVEQVVSIACNQLASVYQ